MNKHIKNISKCLLGLAVLAGSYGNADAAQAQNSRAATVRSEAASPRTDGRSVSRTNSATNVSHSGRTTAARATATRRVAGTPTVSRAATVRTATSQTASRAAATRRVVSASDVEHARTASTRASRAASSNTIRANLGRSATTPARVANLGRSAVMGASRAGVARATAVFDDISKIGGGYGACRDSYSTCMDQFCAKANETFRRCFCSERFNDFRDVELALDQATTLLARFEDNNLNAVDKTAAEVDAMYSATAGEAAIKNDTSGAAALLGEIGDLLSGKTKAKKETTAKDIGLIELDFSTGVDDIWGGGSDIFGGGQEESVNITELDGKELYNQAHKNCIELSGEVCSNTAVFNMAKSSYEILISQDCNAYEKKIESQKSKVEQAVRQAEKTLRDARLEEYRAHNSQDVNDCLDKVRTAITAETACGANYKRCLDHTGAYINQATGEPIYTQRLFQLNDLILLDGASSDVLGQNAEFNDFLDTRKMFANQALDSCRDIADTVWTEFKRSALIEISQAQDEKIEEVKMSCVTTMKECYDTQSGALKSFDDTTAQTAGALSVYAARDMCQEKVNACASLYGNPGACKFDGNGKLIEGGNGKGGCGIQSLLAFVATVDDTRVSEACGASIEKYLKDTCAPATAEQGTSAEGGKEYPWGCRDVAFGQEDSSHTVETPVTGDDYTLWKDVMRYALNICADPTNKPENYGGLDIQTKKQIETLMTDVRDSLGEQLSTVCEEMDGIWTEKQNGSKLLAGFYSGYSDKKPKTDGYGVCIEDSARTRCESYNSSETKVATWNASTETCEFTDDWYKDRCKTFGNSYWDNTKGVCYTGLAI